MSTATAIIIIITIIKGWIDWNLLVDFEGGPNHLNNMLLLLLLLLLCLYRKHLTKQQQQQQGAMPLW